ncbi:hypothetical protein B9Z55_015315 [Caenorhabditis nigoni]|uniref:Uncharacterized protein n=1 Tax=Caenorhabditis nigoni TaxID=1611254 RepID=A0A2G5U9R0_9PELO|nr:hypothetical protein B9Z55_015315 [Caenorhabditis nigoni]
MFLLISSLTLRSFHRFKVSSFTFISVIECVQIIGLLRVKEKSRPQCSFQFDKQGSIMLCRKIEHRYFQKYRESNHSNNLASGSKEIGLETLTEEGSLRSSQSFSVSTVTLEHTQNRTESLYMLDEDEQDRDEEGEDENEDEQDRHEEGEASEIMKPIPIVGTQLDRKLTRRLFLENVKMNIQKIISMDHLKTDRELKIPTINLKLSKVVDSQDEKVKELCKEIEDNKSLRERDPIVVTEESVFHKICASEIEVKNQKSYKLRQFLIGSLKNPKIDFTETLKMCHDLIEYLELSSSKLKQWTSKEVSFVFDDTFASMTKQRWILEMSFHSDLFSSCLIAVEKGIDFNKTVCRDVLRTFRQNPKEVLDILNNNQRYENKEFLNCLHKITPDIHFLLCQKQINPIVATSLCELFEKDEWFTKFVKSCDLRRLDKSDQKSAVIRRFNLFRKQLKVPQNTAEFKIVINDDTRNIDVALISNEKIKDVLWKDQSTLIILAFGFRTENFTYHLLHLPDDMGKEDLDGRLHNVVSLSIGSKCEGKVLQPGQETTTFLSEKEVASRLVFSIDDLKPLFFKKPTVFIELTEVITADLIYNMISPESTLVVRNEVEKKKLVKNLRCVHERQQKSS